MGKLVSVLFHSSLIASPPPTSLLEYGLHTQVNLTYYTVKWQLCIHFVVLIYTFALSDSGITTVSQWT